MKQAMLTVVLALLTLLVVGFAMHLKAWAEERERERQEMIERQLTERDLWPSTRHWKNEL